MVEDSAFSHEIVYVKVLYIYFLLIKKKVYIYCASRLSRIRQVFKDVTRFTQN